MNADAEVDIFTFYVHNADSLNLVHSDVKTDDQFLVSQVQGSGDVTKSTIGKTFLVLEWPYDPFCRQI